MERPRRPSPKLMPDIKPHDIIFSCGNCNTPMCNVYGTHENKKASPNHGKHAEHRIAKLWLSCCGHIVCTKCVENGAPKAMRPGERPVAPCPVCVKERNSNKPEQMLWILGAKKGQYHSDVPDPYFDVPPVTLQGVDGNEGKALLFHYNAMLRYSLHLSVDIQYLRKRVIDLAKAKQELQAWKKREPEIMRYLAIFSRVVDENEHLREQLKQLDATPEVSQKQNHTAEVRHKSPFEFDCAYNINDLLTKLRGQTRGMFEASNHQDSDSSSTISDPNGLGNRRPKPSIINAGADDPPSVLGRRGRSKDGGQSNMPSIKSPRTVAMPPPPKPRNIAETTNSNAAGTLPRNDIHMSARNDALNNAREDANSDDAIYRDIQLFGDGTWTSIENPNARPSNNLAATPRNRNAPSQYRRSGLPSSDDRRGYEYVMEDTGQQDSPETGFTDRAVNKYQRDLAANHAESSRNPRQALIDTRVPLDQYLHKVGYDSAERRNNPLTRPSINNMNNSELCLSSDLGDNHVPYTPTPARVGRSGNMPRTDSVASPFYVPQVRNRYPDNRSIRVRGRSESTPGRMAANTRQGARYNGGDASYLEMPAPPAYTAHPQADTLEQLQERGLSRVNRDSSGLFRRPSAPTAPASPYFERHDTQPVHSTPIQPRPNMFTPQQAQPVQPLISSAPSLVSNWRNMVTPAGLKNSIRRSSNESIRSTGRSGFRKASQESAADSSAWQGFRSIVNNISPNRNGGWTRRNVRR
ncbi:MAG: hypothetical protein M1831_006655 [Alyxoria varia]|nr:MAG: hypothetical protein M1831_006655 [Alyxoria varia]